MRRGLLALVLVALLALSGCGGGDDSTIAPDADGGAESGSAQGDGGGNRAGAADGSSKANGGGSGGDGRAAAEGAGARGDDSFGNVDLSVRPKSVKDARVTPTGAVQTLPPSPQAQQTAQKNTYGSIRSFGTEAEGEEATNITFALVQYLDAKASGDWTTACARIYSVLRVNLEDPEQGKSCPATFGELMSRSPQASRAEQAQIDVSSVRRGEGNRAFVIYKTPETLSADMPMYVEDGVWKVGALEAYALTPDRVG
ncbi:MAG: hypothetical protein WDZ46_03335 [Solirubrobacterales bacterium]